MLRYEDDDNESDDYDNDGEKDADDLNESVWLDLFSEDDNDDEKVNSRDKLKNQYEAQVAKYDTYFEDFEVMMDDFKKLGFDYGDE